MSEGTYTTARKDDKQMFSVEGMKFITDQLNAMKDNDYILITPQ